MRREQSSSVLLHRICLCEFSPLVQEVCFLSPYFADEDLETQATKIWPKGMGCCSERRNMNIDLFDVAVQTFNLSLLPFGIWWIYICILAGAEDVNSLSGPCASRYHVTEAPDVQISPALWVKNMRLYKQIICPV